MSTSSGLYNFIADTCILVVIAYLLARGRMLTLLFRENLTPGEVFHLGLIMGLVGLMEAIFPDVGLPYATHTLFVIFATIIGGLRVGLVTAAIVTLGAFFLQAHELVVPTMLAVLISAYLGKLVRLAHTIPSRLVGGFVVGALAQACRLFLRMVLMIGWPMHPTLSTVWISAPANGFGVALLLLVVSDAQVRAESGHAQALVSQAQLTALRARIRPHFLFNTLNSIAELCGFAPERAEAAILRLSHLMRHALETSTATSMRLDEEIEVAQAYLAIEQERLGSRLGVLWQIDSTCDRIPVPPFAVQTLVENAIHHGLARKKGLVRIQVIIRSGSRHTLVGVRDDGIGMAKATRQRALAEENSGIHGLQILNQHLILLYGRRARLRLFSREGAGTLAAFILPEGARQRPQRGGPPCSPP
jgi:LytS/YehU family sensor histidine kinase